MKVAAITIAMTLLALVAAMSITANNECTTDTECAAMCKANDAQCDGGPQE